MAKNLPAELKIGIFKTIIGILKHWPANSAIKIVFIKIACSAVH